MENWQVEIKRLDKMRLELGLNMNQLEKITDIDRGQLKRFFEFTNVPSMKFYFDVKDALEKEFEVKFADVEVHRDGSVSINLTARTLTAQNSIKAEKVFKYLGSKLTKKDCDCKLENGLLKRGKIKCTLSKAEHKFD